VFMMKRGANVCPIFLDQRPFVGNNYYEKALDVAKKLRKYVPLEELCSPYITHRSSDGRDNTECANETYLCHLQKDDVPYRL